jgi:hypothetical protein
MWPAVRQSAAASASQAWRQGAPGRGLPHAPWGAPLPGAGGRSGGPCPRYAGSTPAGQAGRDKVLPQAPEGVNVCTTCDQHGEAEELWCGQARDAAQCRTPSAQRPQQPHRKLLPTDAATRAAHARRASPQDRPNASSRRMDQACTTADRGGICCLRLHTVRKCSKDCRCGLTSRTGRGLPQEPGYLQNTIIYMRYTTVTRDAQTRQLFASHRAV